MSFLLFSCCVFGALEYYPRVWENSTWMDAHPYFLGINPIIDTEILDEDLEASLNASIPTFQDGLDEMLLDELLVSSGGQDGNIRNATMYKEYAAEISLTLEDLPVVALVSKEMWDVWTYPGDWKNCVDYALFALEARGARLNELNEEYLRVQEKFEVGGACGEDYVGAGTEYCANGTIEVVCDYGPMMEDVPRFWWYYECMEEHAATILEMEARVAEINSAYDSVVVLCEEVIAEKDARAGLANAFASEVAGQNLEHIYKSSFGTASSGALGLRNAYEEFIAMGEIANESSRIADFGHVHEGSSEWMKKCIMEGGVAIGAYQAMLEDDILEEAESVVDEMGEEAHGALEEARGVEDLMGTKAEELFGLAKTACDDGDNIDTDLGLRFDEYSSCLLNARLALKSVEEGEDVIGAQREIDIKWVEGMIKLAEDDGIDTLNEEKLLAAITNTNDPGYMEVIENIKESLAAKAEAKYSYLPKKREELKAWVAGAGESFAYLGSWFEGEDCYGAGGLDYLCAIGNLRNISDSYEAIAKEIEGSRDVFVGEALFVQYREEFGVATLDEPSEAYLYVEVTNPLPFSGEGMVVSVNTDIDFRKIDIVDGGDKVKMVVSKRGAIDIHLSEIGAGETQMVVFRKNETVCKTREYSETAYGDSEGGASVLQEVEVQCTHAVAGLVLGDVLGEGEITLNGMKIGKGSPGAISRELPAGKHTITIESYDYGAYNVDREVSFVGTMGMETKVELFFIFHPNRDLEYIAFSSVEEGKNLDSLDIFGYTGEKIQDKKVVGESTIFFKVKGLREGRDAKVRVSYEISSLEEFVEGAIVDYSSKNLTDSEEALLEGAKQSVFADDYAEAYRAVEELRGLVEKREKEHTKALEKHEEIKEKIRERIALLGEAVSLAEGLGVENAYITEMRARVGELNSSLSLAVPEDATVGPLESLDLGWEKKELTKISKELFSLETELKEGWGELGVESQEMEGLIEMIETKNSEFSGTLDFGDAIEAFSLLEEGFSLLERLGVEKEGMDGELKEELEVEVREAYALWEDYNREYVIAEGTHLEGLFTLTPKEISKELKDLGETEDYAGGVVRAGELIEMMEEMLGLLEEEGLRLEESVLSLYGASVDEMGDADSEFVLHMIEDARAHREAGEYVLSIKSLEKGLDKLEGFEKGDEGILVLAITGLLVLGVVGLYLAKDKIPPGALPIPLVRKEKKREYRRLRRENQ